jgi:acetyl esterase/lipase
VDQPPQTFVYKSVDGVDIHADVYRASPDGTRPVVMWIHGGALIMGTRGDIPRYQRERYLAAGFTVVSIDYRLAPETKLPAIIEDVRDAYAWILREGPALFGLDGARVAVAGHSAGGYLTLMSGFGNAPRPKALVPVYGYGDITAEWYTRPSPHYVKLPQIPIAEALTGIGRTVVTQGPRGSQRYLYYLHTRQVGRWPIEVSSKDPERDPDFFTPYCPLQNVTADYPPTLFIHGALDTDVPYEESAKMARELTAKGVAHEFITLPEMDHAFDMAEGAGEVAAITSVFDQAVAFLRARV